MEIKTGRKVDAWSKKIFKQPVPDAEEADGGSWVLWNGRCGLGGARLVRCLMRNHTSHDRRGAARELARNSGCWARTTRPFSSLFRA